VMLFVYIYYAGIFSNSSSNPAKIHADFLVEKNNTAQTKEFKLEDGTIICLHPGSKTSFPKHFNKDKREVYLEGEAFFKVSKNPPRPFFVYNNQVVTRVLGTSFIVKTFGEQTEVIVKTGRVAVYKNNQDANRPDQVIITPNEKVVYDNKRKDFVISLVKDPLIIVTEGAVENNQSVQFAFDDMPLSSVLSVLQKAYGIQIMMENEKLNSRLMTGDISGHTFFNKLELICQSIGASYEVKGTVVWIKGGH
jgi:ferric-dicitrate binding protein FerR (iron transport regulator)